ncbi:MAG: DUF3108 domain-containing protein [Candidatus Omnitrophota bacterium]
MRKLTVLLILIILLALLGTLRSKFPGLAIFKPSSLFTGGAKADRGAGRVGEKIIYEVKLGKMYLGQSEFRHLKKTTLDGRPVNLVTFQTKITNFSDLETIYSNADDYLPLRVERDIRNWFRREKIIEVYDQKNFTASITKHNGTSSGRKEEIQIKKDGPIQNAVLLPYYLRRIEKLRVGWNMKVDFPTQQLLITLVSIETVEVPAGFFKAYYFESTPPKVKIWVSADDLRIPVKIEGNGLLSYAMSMKKYIYKE